VLLVVTFRRREQMDEVPAWSWGRVRGSQLKWPSKMLHRHNELGISVNVVTYLLIKNDKLIDI
jgi:hypothetical protein